MLHSLILVVTGLLPTTLVLALAVSSLWPADRQFQSFVKKCSLTAFLLGALGALAMVLLKEHTALIGRDKAAFINNIVVCIYTLVIIAYLLYRLIRGKADGNKFLSLTLLLLLLTIFSFTVMVPVLGIPVGFVLPEASAFTTEVLLKWIGYFIGLAAAALIYSLTISASLLCSIRIRCTAAILALLIGLITPTAELVSALYSRYRIPLSSAMFNSIIWIDNNGVWLLFGILAICLATVLWAQRQRIQTYVNPAQKRLGLALTKRRRHLLQSSLATSFLVVLLLTWGSYIDQLKPELSEPEPFEIQGDQIVLNIAAINDGHLHRFEYTTESGVAIRFIVIKKNEFSYGVGFDACLICGKSGYYEQDGQIICARCGVAMNIPTIGYPGGCNPIPLESEIQQEQMTISIADLEVQEKMFA